MLTRRAFLEEHERTAFDVAVAFLRGHLSERTTIEWALRLDKRERVIRLAIVELLNGLWGGPPLVEAWLAAWRLIEESWEDLSRSAAMPSVYSLQARIANHEQSGSLIADMVRLVQPFVEVTAASRNSRRRRARHPTSADDLVSAYLTSEYPAQIDLSAVQDRDFLAELAHDLDSTVTKYLHIGRRIGWNGAKGSWGLGQINRVYFVPTVADGPTEPDAYQPGIAHAVKLLCAAVSRLSEVDIGQALFFVSRWRDMDTPIHQRLWAALARNPGIVSAAHVAAFLIARDARQFWDLRLYPEIAELRVRRFGELDPFSQRAVLDHIKRKPPRSHWPKDVDHAKVDERRAYRSARELQRIEMAGTQLPLPDKAWLDRLTQLHNWGGISRLDEGFPDGSQVTSVTPNPESKFDLLSGTKRLDALQAALSLDGGWWTADPSQRAIDWMRQSGRAEAVFADLEGSGNAGAAYPKVWNYFGSTHKPSGASGEPGHDVRDTETSSIGQRVLALIDRLPSQTASAAIDGIAEWLFAWKDIITSGSLQVIRDLIAA